MGRSAARAWAAAPACCPALRREAAAAAATAIPKRKLAEQFDLSALTVGEPIVRLLELVQGTRIDVALRFPKTAADHVSVSNSASASPD